MARTGGLSGNGSGDIFLAFSTANPDGFKASGLAAIVNAMVAAETMTGADNRRVERLPHDALRAALKKYNRVAP